MTRDPELALDDIQGIAIPGFLKPHQALLSLRMPSGDPTGIVRTWLHMLDKGEFCAGRQALADRDAHRRGESTGRVLVAIGFSTSGLDLLRPLLSSTVPSPAFQAGAHGRASLLGDPPIDDWRPGWRRGERPDVLMVLAGDDPGAVQSAAQGLRQRMLQAAPGVKSVTLQFGNVRPAPHRGREHFGFADGVSQPGIRGTWGGQPITTRQLPPGDPEHDLFGQPGQHLVWPGEFVLGYPAASPDPRLPGPVRPVPAWMHNGSFLVYRRLRQDVDAFRHEMAGEAARLRARPGFAGMTADRLAATLVGRWPSGTPLSRMPHADCPPLGEQALLNNDFRFDDDTPARDLPAGGLPAHLHGTAFRTARADPLGLVCPVASHIRKVNLRDQASDVGGASATQSRRILRVGVPYDDTPENGPPDRGLLFLSIQASIEDQFEFLQARWINSAVRPRGPGGNDMIVGRGERSCVIFGQDAAQAEVRFKTNFVTMTGGGYFFLPSLSALRDLLQGALPQA